MTDLITVDAPTEGEWPTFDTAHLGARIAELITPDPVRVARLQELWTANHLGGMEPLVTAEQYAQMERLVDACEPGAVDQGHRQRWVIDALGQVPQDLYDAAVEQIAVYAGTRALSNTTPLITSEGRMREMERIAAAALDEAATLATIPSVTELPEVPEVPGPETSNDHPGPKAKAGDVVAWVGQDRNRAARAWYHEHERPKPRAGVVDKLRAVLGPEGVAAVQAEIAKHQPPPLDLGGVPGTPLSSPEGSSFPDGDETSPPLPQSGGDPAPETVGLAVDGAEAGDSGEGPSLTVESPAPATVTFTDPMARIATALERIAAALEARP